MVFIIKKVVFLRFEIMAIIAQLVRVPIVVRRRVRIPLVAQHLKEQPMAAFGNRSEV